jgi:hypothetical protein
MAGIYTRDNLAQILNAGLENALKRQGERTKIENARIADNVKSINNFVKSVGYAGEDDDLDEKLKKLQMEKLAAQKAQDEMLGTSMERSGEALNDRYRDFMLGGGLKTAMSPSGPSNGPGVSYEQVMGMKGYVPYGFTVPSYADALKRRMAYSDIMNRGGGIY